MKSSKEDFRIIIAGGRKFNNYSLLSNTMNNLLSKARTIKHIIIITGKAKGADSLGERYAIENGFDIESYPAQWDKYGKQAGYLRNLEMAEHADALVAFWDGESKGTEHMIETAKSKNLDYRIIRYAK
jgi:hypothetical protein